MFWSKDQAHDWGATRTKEFAAAIPDRVCAPEEIWVCGACGKVSQSDCYGIDGVVSPGWDESCVLNAVRCERGDVDARFTGRLTSAKAVQS